ncbi:MAG: hypothetical protein ACWA5P_02185 [bacterium]
MEEKLLLAALLGASIQEIFHWYEIRTKLGLKKYKLLLRSISYWVITILMVIASTLGVYFFLESNLDQYIARDFMVYGFAFPIILKQATKVIASNNSETKLGSNDNINIFKIYFDL